MTFIDSTVIGALLRAHGEAQARGRALALYLRFDSHAKRVLDLTGLTNEIPWFTELGKAIEHLRGLPAKAS